jgi:hypothetical protein
MLNNALLIRVWNTKRQLKVVQGRKARQLQQAAPAQALSEAGETRGWQSLLSISLLAISHCTYNVGSLDFLC